MSRAFCAPAIEAGAGETTGPAEGESAVGAAQAPYRSYGVCYCALRALLPSRSHEPDLAKARKQRKDGRSECRQIVTLDPIEQLKAGAVELICPGRLEDLRPNGRKVATHELRGERPHRQLSRLDMRPSDVAVLG